MPKGRTRFNFLLFFSCLGLWSRFWFFPQQNPEVGWKRHLFWVFCLLGFDVIVLVQGSKKLECSSSSGPSLPTKVWQPGVDKLEEGEELQCDPSAYNSLHAFHVGWPCLRCGPMDSIAPSFFFFLSIHIFFIFQLFYCTRFPGSCALWISPHSLFCGRHPGKEWIFLWVSGGKKETFRSIIFI